MLLACSQLMMQLLLAVHCRACFTIDALDLLTSSSASNQAHSKNKPLDWHIAAAAVDLLLLLILLLAVALEKKQV